MPLNIVQLESRRERLRKEIASNLDFLIGSVTSQGPRGGFSLTTAQNGKTRTKYIRSTLVAEVHKMTRRHGKLKVDQRACRRRRKTRAAKPSPVSSALDGSGIVLIVSELEMNPIVPSAVSTLIAPPFRI